MCRTLLDHLYVALAALATTTCVARTPLEPPTVPPNGQVSLGLRVDIVGDMPDVDADGCNVRETAVLEAAVQIWSSHILTNRRFELTIKPKDFTDAPSAGGRLDAVDEDGIPIKGTVLVDPNLDNNFSKSCSRKSGAVPCLDFHWFVDPTPLEAEEFRQAPEFDDEHRRYEQVQFRDVWETERHFDLMTVLLHEVGHALGWSGTVAGKNPRYDAALVLTGEHGESVPHPQLMAGEYRVPLAQEGQHRSGGYSHIANRGAVPGWKESLMSGVFNLTDRYLPGRREVLMFQHVFGDRVVLERAPGS